MKILEFSPEKMHFAIQRLPRMLESLRRHHRPHMANDLIGRSQKF